MYVYILGSFHSSKFPWEFFKKSSMLVIYHYIHSSLLASHLTLSLFSTILI